MNSYVILSILVISIASAGCNNQSSKPDSGAVAQEDSLRLSGINKETGDTIPLNDDGEQSADTGIVSRIKRVLPVILEKELAGADSSARRFVYDALDLNGDGKNELFVGFTGMNWCGSGGCTALLLSSEGEKITRFTVADFPFTVLSEETKGWKDLVVYSGGKDRLLHWNGKSYPANPSVAPKFTGKLGGDLPKVLANTKTDSWITF